MDRWCGGASLVSSLPWLSRLRIEGRCEGDGQEALAHAVAALPSLAHLTLADCVLSSAWIHLQRPPPLLRHLVVVGCHLAEPCGQL